MDIVADFKIQNSALFPKTASSSLQVTVKPKTMNFPPSGNARVGSASSTKRPQLLPSPSQVSAPNGGGPNLLFNGAWQDHQRRPRSASLSSSPSTSTSTSTAIVTRDRIASEDFSDSRREAGGNATNGQRGGPPPPSSSSSSSPLSSSKLLSISSTAGAIGTQLPSLRSTLDHALGGNRPVVPSPREFASGSSSMMTNNNNNNNTNNNHHHSAGAAVGNSSGVSLPMASSSLSSHASSPSDPASLFVAPKPTTSTTAGSAKNASKSSMFLPVDPPDAARLVHSSATSSGGRGGVGSKTPSPLTLPFHGSVAVATTTMTASEKRKVRFAEPIVHVEPRVKVNVETAVSVPGKVAVMTATGSIREVRPILKATAPPFSSTHTSHSGIATGTLSDAQAFMNAKRGMQTGAHAPQSSVAMSSSPITTTINAINTMNNTLSNKNIVALAPSVSSTVHHTNPTSHHFVHSNQSESPVSLTRMTGAGALPRPSTANAVMSSSSSHSSHSSHVVGSSHHSLATLASGYSTSSRDSAIREMMMLDSPTSTSGAALAFNARDSLTSQSAHLMRKAMEKLYDSDRHHHPQQQQPQQRQRQHPQPDAGMVLLPIDESPRVDAVTGYSDIDPAALRIQNHPQQHPHGEPPLGIASLHLQNGAKTNSGDGGSHSNSSGSNSSSSSNAAVTSALDELRNHHLQTMQTQHHSTNAATATATTTAQTQQLEPLFSDRRRPRTAGPGTVPFQSTGELGSGSGASKDGLSSSASNKFGKELQQPLLGAVGLLSASLGANSSHSSNQLPSTLYPGAQTNGKSNSLTTGGTSNTNTNGNGTGTNNNATPSVSSSASSLFSLPAKLITLGNFSCSAVAPTQFFSQHMVLYFQPAFESARSLSVPYQDMSALTLIGLRFRFKIPSRLLSDVNMSLGGGGSSHRSSSSSSSNVSNQQSTFVLVEFAPSARVQLVKEKVVPLIVEAQSLMVHAPQQFQLMNASPSQPTSHLPSR